MSQSVQKSYFPVRDRKLPRFMGGQYMAANSNNYATFRGLPIPMVTRFHQRNGNIKRKLRVWIAKKFNAVVCAESVLTSAGPKTTPFHVGQDRAQNGNMRNFGPINPHGTAFAPKQWLYQKEGTCMESSKMYCPSRCRYRTYQYMVENGNMLKTSGLLIPMVLRQHQSNGDFKRKLSVWRAQKSNAAVCAETVLSSAGPQTTSFHGGQYRAKNGKMRNFGPTNPHGTAFAPKQW